MAVTLRRKEKEDDSGKETEEKGEKKSENELHRKSAHPRLFPAPYSRPGQRFFNMQFSNSFQPTA